MVCKKTSSQIYIWRWYYIRGFEQTLYLVRGYNPSVFSACKTSRKSSSPYTGEPRTALRWLSARLYLTALRSRALSLPQSYCLNPERSPTAPSSEGAEAAAAAHHRIYLRGSRGRSRAVHRIAAVHNSSFRIPHSHSPLNFLPVGQKNSSTCTG